MDLEVKARETAEKNWYAKRPVCIRHFGSALDEQKYKAEVEKALEETTKNILSALQEVVKEKDEALLLIGIMVRRPLPKYTNQPVIDTLNEVYATAKKALATESRPPKTFTIHDKIEPEI